MRVIYLIAIVFGFCNNSNAVNRFFPENPGNWLMYYGNFRVSNNWYLHNEFQYRSYSISPNTEQVLTRIGFSYQFKDNLFGTAGYGSIQNFQEDKTIEDGIVKNENRIWQQIMLRHKVSNFVFEHRLRVEQRWMNDTKLDYSDRLRYLLRLNLPLNNTQIKDRVFYVSAYNELFLNFSDNVMDRNRAYGALGYHHNQTFNWQLGYLAQTVGAKTGHYLQFSWFCNVDFRKQKSSDLPILKTSDVAIN